MKYVISFVLGSLLSMGFWGSYVLGGLDKQNEIVYNCRDYSKYVISENWQITCNGPYNPMLLMPDLEKDYASRKGKLKESHKR